MSIGGNTSTVGGWQALCELHSNALVTVDAASSKMVGRLAEQAPTLADGTITLLPDGRMKVIHRLRRNVTWHDGTPFTARALVFSYQMANDRGLPVIDRRALDEMESAEAPDDFTFVIYFKGPYYQSDALILRKFWPQPPHLLQEAFDRYQASKDANDVLNLGYWSSEYIHTGPFRLKEFSIGEGPHR
jgi:ABC-type transport system substrate-binding protein